ncbi:hypothetical protein SSS_03397 [Sarcoptes scabiei]|uniref:Uncharacterized protein n=1 Tax=Sarcoptes scabiei TaxID=52283 RepID=A0A834R937_SARSC|nr:hypothetical protein SSS_03397 [Sarcoptes scabiei]
MKRTDDDDYVGDRGGGGGGGDYGTTMVFFFVTIYQDDGGGGGVDGAVVVDEMHRQKQNVQSRFNSSNGLFSFFQDDDGRDEHSFINGLVEAVYSNHKALRYYYIFSNHQMNLKCSRTFFISTLALDYL